MELLEIVSSRVKSWQFEGVYDTANEAKHMAAKLFVNNVGTRVRPVGDSFVVYFWNKEAV